MTPAAIRAAEGPALATCDVCCRRVPREAIRCSVTYGIETWACRECRREGSNDADE